MHQMPLVIFTVLIQAATGLLLCMGFNRLSAATSQGTIKTRSLDEPQIFMWGLFILGLGASFFHLGKPLNALNVFRGLAKGSPLSIEVSCAVIFGALALLYTLLVWKGAGRKTQNAALLLAIVAGIAFSFAVANVYTIITIPLWDSAWTFIQFSMSVAALGIVGKLFLLVRAPESVSAPSWSRWNMAALIILLCLIVSTTLYSAWAGRMLGMAGAESPQAFLPVLRIIFQVLGLFLLIVSRKRDASSARTIYAGIFCCILASELLGRIFFYSLQQVSGMLQIYAY